MSINIISLYLFGNRRSRTRSRIFSSRSELILTLLGSGESNIHPPIFSSPSLKTLAEQVSTATWSVFQYIYIYQAGEDLTGNTPDPIQSHYTGSIFACKSLQKLAEDCQVSMAKQERYDSLRKKIRDGAVEHSTERADTIMELL